LKYGSGRGLVKIRLACADSVTTPAATSTKHITPNLFKPTISP
jgi:hypothetical protein